jgi:hypothetical protein
MTHGFIREIDRTYRAYSGRQDDRRLGREHTKAQDAAREAFARANGWHEAAWGWPALDCVGRGSNYQSPDRYSARADSIFDHLMAFSAKQRIVALVGQPYMKAEDIPSTRTLVAERGLSLHVPPDPFASIHYPGETLFLVVTKPETSVAFLPDQDGSWRG